MDSIRREVERRFGELESLLFLARVADEDVVARAIPAPNQDEGGAKTSDWPPLLKSAAYVCIYNIVEFAVCAAMGRVYDALHGSSVSYREIRSELRSLVAHNDFRDLTTAGHDKYVDRTISFVDRVMDKKLWKIDIDRLPGSGNLTAGKLRHVCSMHGVGLKIPESTRGGADLDDIVQKRNALSHGDRSFVEEGRDVSVTELHQVKRRVRDLLECVLNSFEEYIDGRQYTRVVAP